MSTNETLSKNDLITKLKEIQTLYINAINLKHKMEEYEADDKYPRKIIVPKFPGQKDISFLETEMEHEVDNAIEILDNFYDLHYLPAKPTEPTFPPFPEKYTKETEETKETNKLRIGACIFGLVVGLLSLTSGDTLGTIISILIIIVCCYFLYRSRQKLLKAKENDANKLKELQKIHTDDVESKTKQYEIDTETYQKQLDLHNSAKETFLNEYKLWRNTYLQHLEEESEIEEKLENDRIAVVTKMFEEEYTPALNALKDCNDLVADDYLPALDIIIDLLTSNRADNLKEAINLFEEIIYRERQLQLQREQEEQRRYEEELRRQDEERRYQEEREFREEQERQRRYEEERREQEAERRHNEELKQLEQQERNRQREEKLRLDNERRKMERAELNRKIDEDRATQRQCNTCALVGNCGMAFRRPNCSSYRPK